GCRGRRGAPGGCGSDGGGRGRGRPPGAASEPGRGSQRRRAEGRPDPKEHLTPVDVEIRPVTAEEWVDYLRAEHIPFGIQIADEEMKVQAQRYGQWNTLAAFEEGRIVATAGDWDMHLAVPGGNDVHAPGVTAVGVLPTHRRRGLLTALMRRQLDDFRGRGEAVATLLAAESVIYGRFGYGWATTSMAAELDRVHGVFRDDVVAGAQFQLVDKGEAAKILPDVFEQARRGQPGEVTRPDSWWDQYIRDP